jgi:hypothetical protein
MADTLIRVGLIDHMLILADDVDLLEEYESKQENINRERSILARALQIVHETPGVDVLVTARSWYANSRKEFRELADLSLEPYMSPEELVKIHDCRFSAYVRAKSIPRSFLKNEALHRAASSVQGLPGVFLQHIDTAFQAYRREEDWSERDYDWYVNVFRNLWTQYRNLYPQAAEKLLSAVSNEEPWIDVTELNVFRGSRITDEFVFQSYFRETYFFASALLQEIIGTE